MLNTRLIRRLIEHLPNLSTLDPTSYSRMENVY